MSENGRHKAASLLDYRAPTMGESRGIDVHIVESIDPNRPFGTKEASGPTHRTAATLVGKPLDDAALAVIQRSVKRGIQPMETTLVSVQYRRRATPALAKRLVHRLWEDVNAGD